MNITDLYTPPPPPCTPPLHTHHVEQMLFHSVSCVLQRLITARYPEPPGQIMARAVYIGMTNNGSSLFVVSSSFFPLLPTNLCSSADSMTKIIIAEVFIHWPARSSNLRSSSQGMNSMNLLGGIGSGFSSVSHRVS